MYLRVEVAGIVTIAEAWFSLPATQKLEIESAMNQPNEIRR